AGSFRSDDSDPSLQEPHSLRFGRRPRVFRSEAGALAFLVTEHRVVPPGDGIAVALTLEVSLNGVVADLDSTRVVVDLDVAVDVVVPHQDLPGVVLELDVPADRGVGHGDRSPVLGLDVAVDEGVLV